MTSNNHLETSRDQVVGNPITGIQVLKDEEGHMGMFFVFHDIGIVAPGSYRFRCMVMDMRM